MHHFYFELGNQTYDKFIYLMINNLDEPTLKLRIIILLSKQSKIILPTIRTTKHYVGILYGQAALLISTESRPKRGIKPTT